MRIVFVEILEAILRTLLDVSKKSFYWWNPHIVIMLENRIRQKLLSYVLLKLLKEMLRSAFDDLEPMIVS